MSVITHHEQMHEWTEQKQEERRKAEDRLPLKGVCEEEENGNDDDRADEPVFCGAVLHTAAMDRLTCVTAVGAVAPSMRLALKRANSRKSAVKATTMITGAATESQLIFRGR